MSFPTVMVQYTMNAHVMRRNHIKIYKVLTAVLLRIWVFGDVTLCGGFLTFQRNKGYSSSQLNQTTKKSSVLLALIDS